MFSLEWEALLICLLGSLVWAPLIYLLVPRIDRADAPGFSERLWLAALGLAAAPTLLAPALAALGLSLRAPEPALPMTALSNMQPLQETVVAAPAVHASAGPPMFESIFAALSVLYLYGLVLALALAGARAVAFMFRMRRARPVEDRRLIDAVENWRRRLKVGVRPSLQLSKEAPSVCVYGFFRPVILIPSDLFSRVSFEDGVLMCAHELAHIKRGDARLFALCAVAKAIFWFNPFLRRIAARTALVAEQNADRLVLSAGVDRRAYAACFVEGLKFAARSKIERLAPIPSFTPFDRRSRRQRFDAILSGESECLPGAGKRFAAAAAMAIAGGLVFAQAALAVDPQAREEKKTLDRLPVEGTVSLSFGEEIKGDIAKGRPLHEGVDIAAPRGTVVVAPADGTVVEATGLYKGQSAWGNVVVIDHGDGLVTRYAHLDRYTVKNGDRVSAGEKIGEVGATGNVTGPHLHFEAIQDGEPMDPLVAAGIARVYEPPKATDPSKAPGAPTTLTPAPAAPETPEPPEAAEAPKMLAPAPAPKPNPKRKETRKITTPHYSAEVTEDGYAFLLPDEYALILNGALAYDLPDIDIEIPDIETLELADGSTLLTVKGRKALSPEDRKKLDEALADMRRELKRAERERKDALKEASRALKRAERERKRALELSRAERDKALEEARVARERALEESSAERARALAKARVNREKAQAELQRRLAETQAELRTRQLYYADEESAARERELEAAERELAEQRAEIETLRARLEEMEKQLKAAKKRRR